MRWLKQNWFLAGIVIVILLAKFAPSFGAKGGNSFWQMFLYYGLFIDLKWIAI